jgi:hypothetical protein
MWPADWNPRRKEPEMFSIYMQADEGLTLREVITDIPHDVPAMVVYVMIAVAVYVLWRSNRKKA